MSFSKSNRHHTFNGIFFSCLFALASFYIADITWVKNLGLSPLVIAILLGICYGSTLREHLPHEWTPGIQFVAKRILRIAIIFYGFRLTFQDISKIGLEVFLIDLFVVIGTMIIGTWLGIKIFKLDRDTSILISSGSAICGAAAVLATEGVLKSEPHKASVAVLSVVLFGTIAMFLYPFMLHWGWLPFTETQYGVYAGATIHEVAQVVVAGTQISTLSGNVAIIVKMTRVLLLAPMLIILNLFIRDQKEQKLHTKLYNSLPWFAIGFIAIVAFNSLKLLPQSIVDWLNMFDTFLLTLAMAALGIETNITKIKKIGVKPLYLSLGLFLWLIGIGYTMIVFFKIA